MPTISKALQVRRRLYAEDAKLVEAIKKVGPRNVALLSRLTRLHPETVRYKVKHRFGRAGFKIHAEAAYDRLGLSLLWATIRFQPEYEDLGSKLLYRMGEVGHLVYYGKVIPQVHYKALLAVPLGKGHVYGGLLAKLRGIGVIRDFSIEEATDWRNYSMNPKFFNFQSRRWEVDWGEVEAQKPPASSPSSAGQVHPLDIQDLLIIKELQKDARQHYVSIAKSLHVNEKTLMYHVNSHVEAFGLVRGYEFRWMQDIGKTLSHSGLWTNVVVRGLDKQGAGAVRERFSKVPFLWEDYVMKNGAFSAWFFIPMQELVASYDYFRRSVSDRDCEPEVYTIKNHESCFFTIPYHTFSHGWTADAKAVLGGLLPLLRAKKTGGESKLRPILRENPGLPHQ